MSHIPEDLKYTATHEWGRVEDDGSIVVGITDYAQDLLGDVVYVELPKLNAKVRTGVECAVVESVKAASDIYSPINGVIVEINETLTEMPSNVNSDPYGEGWLFRVRPDTDKELDDLMNSSDYHNQISKED